MEKENKFEMLEDAWKHVLKKELQDEQIQAVEIHWGHGTYTLQRATTQDPDHPYGHWEIIEDA